MTGQRRSDNLARRALVAQLVEHFHGKEGVSGSSPEEGFANRLLRRSFAVLASGRAGLAPYFALAIGTVELGRHEALAPERAPIREDRKLVGRVHLIVDPAEQGRCFLLLNLGAKRSDHRGCLRRRVVRKLLGLLRFAWVNELNSRVRTRALSRAA